jgi:hypothetical protein
MKASRTSRRNDVLGARSLQIAKDTMKMPAVMAAVMGGPNRADACAFINAHEGTRWNEDECEQFAYGLCIYQTGHGLPWTTYCKKKAGKAGWYCSEHAQDLKEQGATAAQLGRKSR